MEDDTRIEDTHVLRKRIKIWLYTSGDVRYFGIWTWTLEVEENVGSMSMKHALFLSVFVCPQPSQENYTRAPRYVWFRWEDFVKNEHTQISTNKSGPK